MKRLAVRLPEPAMRRIKALAALRGVSLQEAVQQALEAWASQPQPGDTHALDQQPGSFAGADLEKLRPPNRAATAKPRRRFIDLCCDLVVTPPCGERLLAAINSVASSRIGRVAIDKVEGVVKRDST